MLSKIIILGLGPGDPKYITREVWQVLETTPEIYLRTRRHPAVSGLPSNLRVHSFDRYYQQAIQFEEVYQRIAERILRLGRRPAGVVYGVPGDPHVAEGTTELILRRAGEEGVQVEVLPGLSFLEPVFKALALDPLPRLALVDAFELATSYFPSFPPDYPALIPQVYARDIAAAVKLTLMGNYSEEHPVVLIHAAGTEAIELEEIPLYLIDRSRKIGPMTCLFVPPLTGLASMESFQELIAHLRSPEGCPWDREQTHLSLRTYLLEEAYEALDALDSEESEIILEELGDLLLQIVLHAQIATEESEFRMTDILTKISEKLISRHPHVFGDMELKDAEAVEENWEKLKREERRSSGRSSGGTLSGVPAGLPALSVADAYQRRATRVGFDWPDEAGVVEKVKEELGEVLEARTQPELASEIGDLLFAVVNLARWSGLDSETVLRAANSRFRARFEEIEKTAAGLGKQISDLTLEEMNAFWEYAKRRKSGQDSG
jgi:tetrapyrrole methylase family protein/MazG family protein